MTTRVFCLFSQLSALKGGGDIVVISFQFVKTIY